MSKKVELPSIETMPREALETRIKNLKAELAYHRALAQSTHGVKRNEQVCQAAGVAEELNAACAALKDRFNASADRL